jgi:wobble nucleotide-excising tRNase
MAAANAAAQEQQKLATPNHKIQKTLKVSSSATPIASLTKKSKGKASKPKVEPKEVTYSEELINLQGFIKKFDIDAVLDQTGNSIGDSHLPRGKY